MEEKMYNITDLEMDAKLDQLQEWIRSHPELPQKIGHVLVRRYLHSVYGNVDKAKKLIEHSYQLRNKSPNLFFNRDPLDAEMEKILQIADLSVGLPKMTQDKYKVMINRLIDFDPEKFHHENITKAFFMAVDHRFSLAEDNDGDIPIFDMTGFSYKHLMKLSLTTLRNYMKFTQEAFPVRLKQIHLINVSPMTSKVLTIVRPFMKNEVKAMLHVHPIGSETLYDFIPQSIMPTEYGGMAGKLDDFQKQVLLKIQENRDFLMDERNWLSRKVTKPKN
ncbi:unnamed protein product [Diamesa serratosioi]